MVITITYENAILFVTGEYSSGTNDLLIKKYIFFENIMFYVLGILFCFYKDINSLSVFSLKKTFNFHTLWGWIWYCWGFWQKIKTPVDFTEFWIKHFKLYVSATQMLPFCTIGILCWISLTLYKLLCQQKIVFVKTFIFAYF